MIEFNKSKVLILSFFLTQLAFSQKIDSTVFNGQQVYIYPFKVTVAQHSAYRDAADMKSMIEYTYRAYSKEIREELGDEMDFKGFDKFVRKLEQEGRREKVYKRKKLIKSIRKNPYPLLNPQYAFSQDIVPCLDPIPDGRYIQYFEPFCLIDRNGKCAEDQQAVAGIFSIQNGLLEGDAVWYDINGDTLKFGTFKEGLKEGKWYLERRKPVSYSFGYSEILSYIERGFPSMDTVIEITEYRNGARNGSYMMYQNSMNPVVQGYYSDGKESGEWLSRDLNYKVATGDPVWNNSTITRRYTINKEENADPVRKVWVRKELLSKYGLGYPDFNFYSTYNLIEPPTDLYSPNFEIEPDLELEEEKIMAYDDYGAENSYGDYDYDYRYGDYMPYQKSYLDANLNSYRKRGEIMDSIGLRPNYSGVYEVHYPNGQLAFRWDYSSESPFVDDTIFWDNGVAHDVVTFQPDSNHYYRSAYDYEGKLYKTLVYDSLGDFLRVDYEFDSRTKEVLDGFTVYKPEYNGNYEYYDADTLQNELQERVTVYRSWSAEDKAAIHIDEYEPSERILTEKTLSMLSNPLKTSEKRFSEDFKSWTGKDTLFAGDLELRAIRSASIFEGWEQMDSVPQMNVAFSEDRYMITSDYQLFKDGIAYSGPVTVDFDQQKFDISKRGLNVSLPKYKRNTPRHRYKQIRRYIWKGKVADKLLFSCINSSNSDLEFAPYFFSAFFGESMGNAFDVYGGYMDEFGMEYGAEMSSQFDRIQGYMHEGKPIGEWKAIDRKGKLVTIANYDSGELNGSFKRYEYAYPAEGEFDFYYADPFGDSLPPKLTHYLSEVMEYKNGMLEGTSTTYNWLGEIVQQSEYKEDYRNGPAIERNKLAFTKMNFLEGALDGYLQTYLTAEPGDTILLYDLNFQNGLLQGESKAYHINGLLAKRGFFLNGEPIDDYEGFDSLGFRYHYVKFQYSFPVEEKIWEENELSVKYNFDWRDSIYFEPSDITSSQSLESMLFDLGFGQDYLERPYYGRPSLVDKSEVLYEMTKYYPNDQVARHGYIENGKKTGCWTYFNYDGEFLYEIDYYDTIITLNDSIRFKVKGIYTDFDHQTMTPLYSAYVIEKFEKYDCSHSDHYEIRQLWTFEDHKDTVDRMNGYVVNYYDNGTIQSEGQLKDGLPTGFWKIYDPFGKLNQYGQYVMGKRHGRWLSGDLSKTKYLGDICLNPNLPDFEDEVQYRENLLNVVITSYKLGAATSRQYYDINMNRFIDETEDSMPPEEIIEE